MRNFGLWKEILCKLNLAFIWFIKKNKGFLKKYQGKAWLFQKLAILLHSLNGTRHTAKAAKQRSLKDFHKTFVEKYKEDKAALLLWK